MPRGDFFGGKNMGLPLRTREAPTRAFAVLDKGRSLTPSLHASNVPTKSLRTRRVQHAEDGTPMGYSQMFEAYVSYTKDRWCSPSCQCLHYAAASGDDAMTEAAAEGRKPFTRKHGLEDGDDAGRTPIMVAAWKGNAKCVKWLAEHGANLNAVDKRGRTVAHWACLSTNTFNVIEPLCGKNVDIIRKDQFGDTCLHKIVADRDVKTAELLCKFFPRLTTIKNKDGKLPMELAAPHKDLVEAVSPQAAAQHVKNEKDKILRMAMEMEERDRQQAQQKQIQHFEEIVHKRRASAAGAAHGIQASKFRIGSDTHALPGIGEQPESAEIITDENDEWAELEAGPSLQSLAEEEVLDRGETLQVDDQDEELEEDQEVSFFSAMVDVKNKKELFFRREGRARRTRSNWKTGSPQTDKRLSMASAAGLHGSSFSVAPSSPQIGKRGSIVG